MGPKVNRFRDIHCCVDIREMLWSTRNTLLWAMLSVRKVCNNSYPVGSAWTDNGTIKAVARCTQLGTVEVGTCIWFMMVAEDYTFAEMADIHFFYGCANSNAPEARRLYQETFPNRRLPCNRTISRIAQRLRERDKFIPTFIRTSYAILKGYPHMGVSGYLGTCSLLDPCWYELFCLIRGGE
jgi:hypothetical protein